MIFVRTCGCEVVASDGCPHFVSADSSSPPKVTNVLEVLRASKATRGKLVSYFLKLADKRSEEAGAHLGCLILAEYIGWEDDRGGPTTEMVRLAEIAADVCLDDLLQLAGSI